MAAYWWTDAAIATNRELGEKWVASRSSLATMVPSVPIRAEWNVLVNPLHPRIGELQIDPPPLVGRLPQAWRSG